MIVADSVFNSERSGLARFCDLDELVRSENWIFREIGREKLYNLGSLVYYKTWGFLTPDQAKAEDIGVTFRILEDVAFASFLADRFGIDKPKTTRILLEQHCLAWPVSLKIPSLLDSRQFKRGVQYFQYAAGQMLKGDELLWPEDWDSTVSA